MKIGNLDLGNKLFLAPMAEVSDSSFRKVCHENGAGLTFTQMVSAKGVIQNDFETLRNLSFNRSVRSRTIARPHAGRCVMSGSVSNSTSN